MPRRNCAGVLDTPLLPCSPSSTCNWFRRCAGTISRCARPSLMTDTTWLVVMALPLEAQEVFEKAGVPVLYTGVGKVNATLTLARALSGYRHSGQPLPNIVNFGSAGSPRLATGTVVACTAFHQRDMDVSGL